MASIDLSTSPWLTRMFDRAPVSLPVLSTLIVVAHFISIALFEWTVSPTFEDNFIVWTSLDDVTGDIIHSVLVGYLLVASYYGLREAVRDFLKLQPAHTLAPCRPSAPLCCERDGCCVGFLLAPLASQ